MKKFRFALETVLSYKQQVLEALQGEQAAILAEVYQQEQVLAELKDHYQAEAAEYRTRCSEGMEIKDVLAWQAALRARERGIEAAVRKLDLLKKKAEEKRQEVVAAKQDTSSIEKLREKQLSSYNMAVAKSEEKFIEEFVTSRRSSEGA